MREVVIGKGLRNLIGKKNVDNGYVSRHINEHSLTTTGRAQWRFRHKPYTCDYPAAFVRQGGTC